MSQRSIRRQRERGTGRELKREGRLSRRTKAATGAGAALGATVLFAPAAEAGTFTVTSLDDDFTDGTLRYEIFQANVVVGDDTVVFQSGLTGTIELNATYGPIPIYYEGLAVQGPGASQITVDGHDDTGVFYLQGSNDPNTPVSISGLTIANGTFEIGAGILSLPDFTYAADLTVDEAVITGGYALSGGGIFAVEGDLTITNSVISSNRALYEAGGVFAAATPTTTIQNTAFTGNESAYGAGGGLSHVAGYGPTTIENSVFSGNDGNYFGGGAILYNSDGPTVVRNSTFSGNETLGGGAGLSLYNVGDQTVDSSTFSGNVATEPYSRGGGMNLHPGYDGDPAVVQNSTFSGNSATYGGGIYANEYGPEDPKTIRNTTIVGNTADGEGGGIAYASGGQDGTLEVRSTIVANNTAGGEGPDLAEPDNAGGTFTLGFSLIENNSDATTVENPAGSNLFGVDPLLGPLQSNGGPTQTHLPAVNSPALDKGIAGGLPTDQRGLARTGDLGAIANAAGGDGTDIGSVELQTADCQGTGALKVDGTTGNDTLTGTDGPDSISGLAGNDAASGGGGNDCVNGDEGRDNAKGGPGKDIVKGGAGKDKGSGGGGKDKVKGNAGKDRLKGGGKNDKLSGAGGKDVLKGGGGKDRLKGGPGKDKLAGGGGKDRFNCGGGNDKVTAQAKDKVSASCEQVVEKG